MADPLTDTMFDPSLKPSRDKDAIDAALACDWEKAEQINKQIVKDDPKNIASLNRLARALFEQGKYQQAKKVYHSVLDIDPYNPIAQKNLKRATAFKKNEIKTNGASLIMAAISPASFLEEAGITKVVSLIKVAEPQKLSKLYAGAQVNILTKNRGITITDMEKNYLGALPDDIGHLLLKLIKGGNKYMALIKSVKSNGLSILIREVFRSKRFKNQPSFLDSNKNLAYSSDNITLNYSESVSDGESDEVSIN